MSIGVIIVLAICLVLLLAILGTMRETVIMRGEVTALAQLITDPPPPSFLGDRIPDALAQHLVERVGSKQEERQVLVVALVSPTCSACKSLVAEIERAVSSGALGRSQIFLVVTWPEEPNPSIYKRAAMFAEATLDEDGTLARACELRFTPTLIAVDVESMTATAHKPGGDIRWIYDNLNVPAAQSAATKLEVSLN
ncbi:MAG: hypothetical protein ACRDMX_16940 [Solirubrobacteraceae bacterium]